jgi:tRNA threonylcarbamoyladenosine modification (KEOPS) complex  Pcc1 subunit
MRAEAIIRLRFSSDRLLRVLLEALGPEMKAARSRRSRAEIRGEQKFLTLMFEARDPSALRAALNSYLRWILLTTTVVESIELVGSGARN